MPDLKDGESIEVQGSARQPYVLKNVGGVYSCSCPAWRNQSLPIERRTCKHLRKLRGDQAEQQRVGGLLPTPTKTKKPPAPKLLLAQVWQAGHDVTDWWVSEKLDGVRAYWDGRQFLSRQGNVYRAPVWFTERLPQVPLDGELWLDRKAFQRTVSIVRRHDEPDTWRQVSFVVFDAPAVDAPFETRLQFAGATLQEHQPPFARLLEQNRCTGLDHLHEELARVESLGGEGLMLRQPESRYEAGRSNTLLKVKAFRDAEAHVIDHVAGRGRHKGRLGALRVRLPDGTEFSVGSGFSDAQRNDPPAVGATVTFRYQEFTDGGVPRFPSFVGVRDDVEATPDGSHAAVISTTHTGETSMSRRRFEFVDDRSDKFWEVEATGTAVTVRYGRNGTDGQTMTKNLDDAEQARRYADKQIASKLKKGYAEVAIA